MSQKTCHGLAIAGLILGGVSILMGGALLDTIGFICALIAFLNIKKILVAHPGDPLAMNTLKLSKIALVVCCVLAVANLLTAIFLAPAIMNGTGVAGPTF